MTTCDLIQLKDEIIRSKDMVIQAQADTVATLKETNLKLRMRTPAKATAAEAAATETSLYHK